jgi:hypothetical protein
MAIGLRGSCQPQGNHPHEPFLYQTTLVVRKCR